MTKTTKAQRKSIARLAARWERDYRSVRESIIPGFGMQGAVIIPPLSDVNPIWIAVETDGYAHS